VLQRQMTGFYRTGCKTVALMFPACTRLRAATACPAADIAAPGPSRPNRDRHAGREMHAPMPTARTHNRCGSASIPASLAAALGVAAVGMIIAPASTVIAQESVLELEDVPFFWTRYDGLTDDLLTAGLGVGGIRSATPPALEDPVNPTPAELRRLAIYTNTRALVDTSEDGGYGRLYGPGVPLEPGGEPVPELIAGDEFITYSRLDGGRRVTVMVQVPDSFDPARPCIVTGPSSGSRGAYGAIGTSGEWGLKKGCAVAYTDKGTGTGAHDLADDTVNLIRGERAEADTAERRANFIAPITEEERLAFDAALPDRFAFKHAHSERNPERLWGRDVLDSIAFAFLVLNTAVRADRFPGAPLFTPGNTIVIASSVSNGGGASIQAAEQDRSGLIDGVAVSEPNVNPVFTDAFVIRQGGGDALERHSRPLYDYVTLVNLYQGCANLAEPDAPLNPIAVGPAFREFAVNRCASLRDKGLLESDTREEQAAEAQAIINEVGLLPEQNAVLPSHWFLQVPQAIAVTYANAYGRFGVLEDLCGYSFGATDPAAGAPVRRSRPRPRRRCSAPPAASRRPAAST
jgi:hydroxybutyrate-dimer hydrolase